MSKTHQIFSVRLPISTYLAITDLALKDGFPMSVKVNQLLDMGLEKHSAMDRAVRGILLQLSEEDNNLGTP